MESHWKSTHLTQYVEMASYELQQNLRVQKIALETSARNFPEILLDELVKSSTPANDNLGLDDVFVSGDRSSDRHLGLSVSEHFLLEKGAENALNSTPNAEAI
jgi:hypothetical protein